MFYTDQMNRQCVLEKKPERIVSLVPSQSELLWDLGLQNELAGITKFCIHPEKMFHTIPRIGGTKQLDLDAIRKINPDLIIGNKEENDRKQIEALEKEFPVWMSDINNLGDAIEMIKSVGMITQRVNEAARIADTIFASFSKSPVISNAPKAIYLIWNKPFMAAGKNTFIDEMIRKAGFTNLISESRYPELTEEQIADLQPEYLLLSSEPYPFEEKHVDYWKKRLPETKTIIVDGEFFSWYGSRLQKAPEYFNTLRQK
ncbi:MAG TPA: cobalamin-binding protein [Flavobacteriales bacterium]|nr:cobalamin-binding protein [Flavobacteriales bacterium]HCA83295.1 cobalamin-binding protein [Flavobacteriales bacterium]HRE73950.1 helical backbone metal receptor [Flavobacteriales bacterium]HRJ39008.1 helical backbone metal receptor [Flavobacteriales bacterium]